MRQLQDWFYELQDTLWDTTALLFAFPLLSFHLFSQIKLHFHPPYLSLAAMMIALRGVLICEVVFGERQGKVLDRNTLKRTVHNTNVLKLDQIYNHINRLKSHSCLFQSAFRLVLRLSLLSEATRGGCSRH